MKFVIESIETKTPHLRPTEKSPSIFVFKFVQINRGLEDFSEVSIVLPFGDSRIDEWYSAFHEKRYFELEMKVK